MGSSSLSLIVLRTSKTREMLSFYRILGFAFNEEKHGSGPIHHSAQTGSTVLEIYPGEDAEGLHWKAAGATMLGFSVESLDQTLGAFEELSSQLISAPKDSPWGRRAVLTDPDGRAIELSEPKKN